MSVFCDAHGRQVPGFSFRCHSSIMCARPLQPLRGLQPLLGWPNRRLHGAHTSPWCTSGAGQCSVMHKLQHTVGEHAGEGLVFACPTSILLVPPGQMVRGNNSGRRCPDPRSATQGWDPAEVWACRRIRQQHSVALVSAYSAARRPQQEKRSPTPPLFAFSCATICAELSLALEGLSTGCAVWCVDQHTERGHPSDLRTEPTHQGEGLPRV